MTAIRSAIQPAIQPAIRAAISGVYGSSSAWSPLELFAASEVGVWYDPSDLSTLWQDTAGTTPVTADGQTVARIDDKSGNGKHATQSDAAKRPLYKTSGGLHWLQFDGADDSLVTSAIDFRATDKVTASSGVRKGTSAATEVYAELSTSTTANNSAFLLYASMLSGDVIASFGSKGTTRQNASYTAGPVPFLAVLTGLGDISGDSSIVRVNGTATATSADQGTGNYGNYEMYIGGRAGTSLFTLGNIYSLIVRGAASSAGEINSLESWIAGKTGVSL